MFYGPRTRSSTRSTAAPRSWSPSGDHMASDIGPIPWRRWEIFLGSQLSEVTAVRPYGEEPVRRDQKFRTIREPRHLTYLLSPRHGLCHNATRIRAIEPNGMDARIEFTATKCRGVKPEREAFAVRGPRRKSRSFPDPAQLRSVYTDRVQDAPLALAVVVPFFVHGERQALTVRRPHRGVQAHPFGVGNHLHVGSVGGHREYPRIRCFVAATPRIGVALRIVVRDEGDSGPVRGPDRVVLEACTSRQPLPTRAVRVRHRDLILAADSVESVLAGGVHDSRAVGRDIGVMSVPDEPPVGVMGIRIQVGNLPHPCASRVDSPDRLIDAGDQRGGAVGPVKESAMGDEPWSVLARWGPCTTGRGGRYPGWRRGGRGSRHAGRRWRRRGSMGSRPRGFLGRAGLGLGCGGRRCGCGRVHGTLALAARRPRNGHKQQHRRQDRALTYSHQRRSPPSGRPPRTTACIAPALWPCPTGPTTRSARVTERVNT